jgi:hypothetical protein
VVGREARDAAVPGRLSEAALQALPGRGRLPDSLLAEEGRPLACRGPVRPVGRVDVLPGWPGKVQVAVCCGGGPAHLRRHARDVAAEAGGPGLLQQLRRRERRGALPLQLLQQQRHLGLELQAAVTADRAGPMRLISVGAR